MPTAVKQKIKKKPQNVFYLTALISEIPPTAFPLKVLRGLFLEPFEILFQGRIDAIMNKKTNTYEIYL